MKIKKKRNNLQNKYAGSLLFRKVITIFFFLVPFPLSSSSLQIIHSSKVPLHDQTLGHDVIRGMMGMMRVSVFVLPVICPRIAAPRTGGTGRTGSVMAVTAVATETTVRLSLVQPAGRNLLAVSRRVIHRLRVLVLVIETIGWLGIGVRVFSADLRVNRGRVLVLQTVILGPVLRRVLVLVVRFP